MNSPDAEADVIRYVGYDTATGRVVHTHAQFSVRENRYVEVPVDELRARFSADPLIVAQLSNGDPGNLDFIRADAGVPADAPVMVDHVNRRLMAPPRVVLSADRTELAGDGQDSANLSITVVGEDGQVVESATGTVQVETSRGKLSVRGGRVELSAGRADVTLTSVNETVRQVLVRAAVPGQPYSPAELTLEFT
jgi:hypothetical protein